MSRIGLSMAALAALMTSCVAPFGFQDPALARQSGFSTQKGFATRPTLQQGSEMPSGLEMQALSQAAPSYATTQDNAYGSRLQAPQSAGELLSWEGQLATNSGEGQTRLATGQRKHGLEPQVDGRMHILNLYQEALDERDSLLIELQRLNTALSAGEQLLTQLRASEKEHSLRLAALEEVKRTLVDQNRDLSARLTIAQIRRLESDKMLLETQISMHSAGQLSALAESSSTVLVSEK